MTRSSRIPENIIISPEKYTRFLYALVLIKARSPMSSGGKSAKMAIFEQASMADTR